MSQIIHVRGIGQKMKKVEVTTTIKEVVESNDDCGTASDLRPNQSIPILLEGERAR